MENITNETFLSSNEAVSLQLCARALKEFLATNHSFSNLDESRSHTDAAPGILFLKYFYFLFLGMPNNGNVTLLLILALVNTIYIILARNYILNFTISWIFFACLLCYRSRALQFPTIARFVFSVTILCLAPIQYHVPCTLDYIRDVALVAHAGIYILETFLGPIEDIMIDIFCVATVMGPLYLAFGLTPDAKETNFMLTGMFFLLSPLTFRTFIERKLSLFLVISFIQSYFVYEQFLIYRRLSANLTYDQLANITYHDQLANVTYHDQLANVTYHDQLANITYHDQLASNWPM